MIKRYATNQDQLASYVNKKQTSISNWINEISAPDVNDLVLIHQYFGISLDALVFLDIKSSKIVTDDHVSTFKRIIGKVDGKVSGKVDPVNRAYFVDFEGLKSVAKEPDSVLLYTISTHFKALNEKVDQVRVSVDKLAQKG